MRRRVAVAVLVLIALGTGAGMKAMRAKRDAADRQAFFGLVQHVAQHGEPGERVPQMLEFIGLPSGDTTFRSVAIPVDASRVRTFTVRKRDGIYDVILDDAYPDRASHVLASEVGELIRAAYIEDRPVKLEQADARFAHERSTWLEWWARQEQK